MRILYDIFLYVHTSYFENYISNAIFLFIQIRAIAFFGRVERIY